MTATWRSLALLVAFASASTGSVVEITDDTVFEERVMKEDGCWAVLFTATTRPEESTKALRQWELLAAANKQLTFGTADVVSDCHSNMVSTDLRLTPRLAVRCQDMVRGVVSEFNMRKRMIPRVLVFNTRARQAEIVRKETVEGASTDGLATAVLGFFAENPTKEDGDCLKMTLAIGGKPEL